MINKKSMWFISLFSLIIVMFCVYLTLPTISDEQFMKSLENDYTMMIEQSPMLLALKIRHEEETLLEINALQKVLLDETKSSQEKNNAYDEMKNLNINMAKEDEIKHLIKNKYDKEAFVKIKFDTISIIVESKNHSYDLANDIMRDVQNKFDSKKYISVKFET